MPNKRDKTKSLASGYVDDDLKRKAQEILSKKGLTLTDAILEKLVEIVETENKKHENKSKK